MSTAELHRHYKLAALMEVLETDDPRRLYRFEGDSEHCAEIILDTLTQAEADAAPERSDIPVKTVSPNVTPGRVFTSDDAAAIAGILIVAPVIGVATATAAWLRRRHREPARCQP